MDKTERKRGKPDMEIDKLKSPLIRTLAERGFIHQATDIEGLDELASATPLKAYIGFDLTAPSLHVGSMIQLMALRHLKAHGHEGIVLFGDATTRVGDPSDKNGARPVLTDEVIEENRIGIVRVIDRVLGACRHVHNADWLDGMSFMDFLTGPARRTSLNRMLTMDIVSRRIDANLPMTVMELLYSLMQGMDFAELGRRHGVTLQIGGSDQWSNILAGLDLARHDGNPAFGLTTPLMTDEQGRKMGKTADGKAVWLSPELVSSFDLWQFWRNVPDGKVAQFLGLFTELPMDEVRRLSALSGSEINEAKKILATEAVTIAHDRACAEQAARGGDEVFAGSGESREMPTFAMTRDQFDSMTLADLAVASGLADSKGATRRLAAQGGFRVNGVATSDVERLAAHMLERLPGVISSGRKKHIRIVAGE
jgi:tyrosyl-tRNA synthetase